MTSHDELRLLPWAGPDGKPCFLSTDDNESHLSNLADALEATYLNLAAEILNHATEVLNLPEADSEDLRAVSINLTEALCHALRVAESRGRRLPQARSINV
ncbi:hypothetical protein [Streptomyces sp. NPDC012825]|uniref:hypothetical protein n=1 Tax=Streptomyces sp. NPDC012825 TaxID=3364851 RepID=UPI0036945677